MVMACSAPSQYLKQGWPSSMTHICGTRGYQLKSVVKAFLQHSHWDSCMLQELLVQTTRQESVEMAAFCGLDQLLELNLANNRLSSAPHLCTLKCSLETLDLAQNKISTIRKTYLKGFKNLRRIVVDENNIIQLPYLNWVQHSLSEIKASHNCLTSLEAFKPFGIFKHLSSIHLGKNNIRRFNVTLLRHMPKLTNLELYSNNITHVDDFRSFYDRKNKFGRKPLALWSGIIMDGWRRHGVWKHVGVCNTRLSAKYDHR